MELNFEGLEMQKGNIPTDRAQRVDEKNGAICLAIMLTPRIMENKMSKMACLLYFLLMAAKNQSVWTKCVSTSERSYLAFLENAMDCQTLNYHYQDINP